MKPFVPTVDDRIRASAAKILPFRLTAGQKQALKEADEKRAQEERLVQPATYVPEGMVEAAERLRWMREGPKETA